MSGLEGFRTSEEQTAFESRAAFKSFLDFVGYKLVADAIENAEQNQEKGLEGVTIPSEDHLFSLSVNSRGVSFRMGDLGPHLVSIDTAKVAIQEKEAEPAPAS